MFASLIRRKGAQTGDEAAFDSTTFSLTTAVPRPAERRADDRLIPLLKVAKLVSSTGEQLMRVRNVTAGGLMAEINSCPPVGEQVAVELSSQKIPSSVIWIREGLVGISSTRRSTWASFWRAASRATAFARGRRGSGWTARPRCGSARSITRWTFTTSRWAE